MSTVTEAFLNAKNVLDSLDDVISTLRCVKQLVPCVAALIAAVIPVAQDAVFAHVSLDTSGHAATSFFALRLQLPCGKRAVVRRLLAYGVHRMIPRKWLTRLVTHVIGLRLFRSESMENFDRIRKVCWRIANETPAVRESEYQVMCADVWQVLSPTTYVSDRIINFALAKLRGICLKTPALRRNVHIPSTHFIVSARRLNDPSASRRLFGPVVRADADRFELPRLTLVVLHDPIGKHWSLAAIVRKQHPCDIPYSIILCDSLKRPASTPLPEDVAVLRHWLAVNAAGMESHSALVPCVLADSLPKQQNDYDCGLFVLATIHVLLRTMLDCDDTTDLTKDPSIYAKVQWPASAITRLRGKFIRFLIPFPNRGCDGLREPPRKRVRAA